MRVRKNDQVIVVRGKDRGKLGHVLSVDPKHGRVVVEGVNVVKRHVKPSPALRQAGIVERPAPMSMTNLKVICDKCGKPTKVGYHVIRVTEMGAVKREKVRVCKSCQQQIG